MKKMMVLMIAAAPLAVNAGTYSKFTGRWKVTECTPKADPAIADLHISATGEKKDAINVYFLNAKGKKQTLHFSTAPIFVEKGHLLIDSPNESWMQNNHSNSTGIRVELRGDDNNYRIEIVSSGKDQLTYTRKTDEAALVCQLKRAD